MAGGMAGPMRAIPRRPGRAGLSASRRFGPGPKTGRPRDVHHIAGPLGFRCPLVGGRGALGEGVYEYMGY
jgi:hypothetical protein